MSVSALRQLSSLAITSLSIVCFGADKTFTPTFFFQSQYRDSNEITSTQFRGQHGFAMRRVRPGFTFSVGESISGRVVFELAAGANQDEARLKDAFVSFTPLGEGIKQTWTFGQFSIPFGGEVARSAAEIEMPERTGICKVLFPGESVRGINWQGKQGPFTIIVAGVDSMTVDDLEALGKTPSPGGRLAALGVLRYGQGPWSFGLSHFAGERPAFTNGANTSPMSERSLTSFDIVYADPTSGFSFRSEFITGRDRLQQAMTSDRPMESAYVAANFTRGAGTFFSRYSVFDPDTAFVGNQRREVGIGYRHNVGNGLILSLSHERFEDDTRPRSWNVTTFRVQLKF